MALEVRSQFPWCYYRWGLVFLNQVISHPSLVEPSLHNTHVAIVALLFPLYQDRITSTLETAKCKINFSPFDGLSNTIRDAFLMCSFIVWNACSHSSLHLNFFPSFNTQKKWEHLSLVCDTKSLKVVAFVLNFVPTLVLLGIAFLWDLEFYQGSTQ